MKSEKKGRTYKVIKSVEKNKRDEEDVSAD